MIHTTEESGPKDAAYRAWEPGEQISSPGSSRHEFSVRNRSDGAGKYSLRFGSGSTKQYTIRKGARESHDVGGQAVVGVNKGNVALEWQRT